MKYYLCYVGEFQDGGEKEIINHCLDNDVYQYYRFVRQKGAGALIQKDDVLILIYKKEIIGYGIADGTLGEAQGDNDDWSAVTIRGGWNLSTASCQLPYGVYWHTLQGNKQSVVKEIDSLWANELIFFSAVKTSMLFAEEPVISLHLPMITSMLNQGFLSIPAVQRGKVWNAVRAEILWDSLMRNLPIGTLSVRPIKNGTEFSRLDLLDGQQRTNAIALGYRPFPNEKSLKEKKEESILWIDLENDCAELEQNDGRKKRTERKFFFFVTTRSQPWGYVISDNETSTRIFPAWERRESVDAIENWELKATKGERPYPYELWPRAAKLPVPFTVLRQYCEQNKRTSFDDFKNFCRTNYEKCNWIKNIVEEDRTPPRQWDSIVDAINNLNTIVVLAQNTSNVPNGDIGLYFKRLNKAGIEPSTEEIRYSLLKSRLPELKALDGIAGNRMSPSRLADIVMLLFRTQKSGKWHTSLSFSDITNIANDGDFAGYVASLENKLVKIEKWLLYDLEKFPCGLLKVHYSYIARSNPDLLRLLLFFVEKGYQFGDPSQQKQLVALVTLVAWFGSHQMVAEGYNNYKESENDDWLTVTRRWLFESVRKELLIIPPPVDVYKDICNAVTDNSNTDGKIKNIQNACRNQTYSGGINLTWDWASPIGRNLLLYSVREYIQDNFANYDPVGAVWGEDCRPWDYDHIFPQVWLRNRGRNGNGHFHNIVALFLNSIGNIAPLDFSKNRGKGKDHPEHYQGDNDNKSLLVDTSKFGNITANLRDDSQMAFLFIAVIAERLQRLYSGWYDTLNIADLLNFHEIHDKRKDLFRQMQNRLQCKVYFTNTNNGFQYPCRHTWDWARPWLAAGIVRDNPHKDFICIASDGTQYEIGKRRHPDEPEIDGDRDRWWFDEPEVNNNTDIDELVEKYECLAHEKDLGGDTVRGQ